MPHLSHALTALILATTLVSYIQATAAVSLLQDDKGLQCQPVQSDAKIEKVALDAKDQKTLVHYKNQKAPSEFETFRFMGSALLAKSHSSKSSLLFQIQNNGEILALVGDLYPFKEKDCEDTGASKSCRAKDLGELFWSYERLALKNLSHKKNLEIATYGVYPKLGTYFLAIENPDKKGRHQALALLDYGAPVELLAGELTWLNCNYSEAKAPE